MKKNCNNKTIIVSIMLVLIMVFSSAVYAFDGERYVALGADLKAEEMSTVLGFFEVGDLSECEAVYVTNDEEYQYLSSYVDAAQIGNQALSSVMIEKTDGSSIDIELHNINYCTEGMYRNALATAGVSGASVVVAGPYEISGTAALVGTIKAYEEMTGEDVGDEVIEAAVEEITTTGDIGEEIGDKEAVEQIIADIKNKIADDPDMSDNELLEAISDAAEKAGVVLSEDNINKIKDLLRKLQSIDIDWGNVKEQSLEILGKLEESGLFDKIINWIKSLLG